MRETATRENNRATQATRAANSPRSEAINTRDAALVPQHWCLPESTGGEACSCQDSREGGVQTSVALAIPVLLGHL